MAKNLNNNLLQNSQFLQLHKDVKNYLFQWNIPVPNDFLCASEWNTEKNTIFDQNIGSNYNSKRVYYTIYIDKHPSPMKIRHTRLKIINN